MNIAVGSSNPGKIKAVELAFALVWPEVKWVVRGVDIASNIAAQPMSDEECITGARNRAQGALSAWTSADYGVGLEGGLQKVGEHHYDCGWMVIVDRNGAEGIGSSIKLAIPDKMLKLIQSGKELGEVVDMTFGTTNSKQSEGHFGQMTNNIITRIHGYRDGVIAALSRFIRPEIFK